MIHEKYDGKIHELYQRMFDEIHAPETLVERIINSLNEKKKFWRLIRLGYGLVAAAAVFIVSNVITYAATGESWTEKFIVYINGSAIELEMQYSTENDGSTTQTMDINLGDYVESQEGNVHIESGGVVNSVAIDAESGEVYVEINGYSTEILR